MMAMAAICQQTHDYGGLIINILYMPAVIEALTVHIYKSASRRPGALFRDVRLAYQFAIYNKLRRE